MRNMSEALTDQPIIDEQPRWPALAMIVGGAVMVAVWPIFTTLHGPTSVNEGGEFLGFDPEFWSAMMEGPPLLFMAAGLSGSRRRFTENATRGARIGLALSLIGLVVPAIGNLAVLAVWPPLLAPLLGAGLIMIARGQRGDRSMSGVGRRVLVGMGFTQLFAFFWFLLVRPDVLDQINGYRIYGVVANVLFGLGWILLGVSLLNSTTAPTAGAD
jgi:hypothetical protein